MKRTRTFRRLCLAMAATIFVTGCGIAASTWITEGEAIVSALVPGIANILTLVTTLKGGTVSASQLQTITNGANQATADMQLAQSLIAQYKTAAAADQPGILGKIQAASTDAQNNLNAILPALHIVDPATQAKIEAVVGLLISEENSLVALFPIVDPSASPAALAQATRQAKKTPPLTAKEFKRSYNAVMTAKTGNVELDKATAGLRLK